MALAVDRAGTDVECGEQVGGAVPDVVMGAFLSDAEIDGSQRLGPVRRLNLGLLVDREHHGCSGLSRPGAVPELLPVCFPRPLAEPGARVSTHRALHGRCRQAVMAPVQGLGMVLPR